MIWRPKDWAETRRQHCNEQLKDVGGARCETCPADPQTCSMDYQAGADAMFDALKREGHYVNGEAPALCFGKGWVTFIAEEKV